MSAGLAQAQFKITVRWLTIQEPGDGSHIQSQHNSNVHRFAMMRRSRFRTTLNLDPATKPPPSVTERAYQLARSGNVGDVGEICQQLRRDGYGELYLHFAGTALQADLSRICRRAQGQPKPASQGNPPRNPSRPPPARRYELKAAECRQIADNAGNAETRQIYIQLALFHEELAAGANERNPVR